MSAKTFIFSPLGDVAVPISPTSMDGIVIGATTPAQGNFTGCNANYFVAYQTVITPSVIVSGTITLGGPILVPVQTSINVTATTNTYAAAQPLIAGLNVVVSASATGPVALPSAATFVGGSVAVFNQSTHTVAVWPQPLDGIDALGTTAAILLDAGKRALFFGIAGAVGTTTLGSIISAQMGVTSA